jgi:hypothetical protein
MESDMKKCNFDWGTEPFLEGYSDGTQIDDEIVPYCTREQLEAWDDATENCMTFDAETGTLLVDNATRLDPRNTPNYNSQKVDIEIAPEAYWTQDGDQLLYDLSPLIILGWTWVKEGEEDPDDHVITLRVWVNPENGKVKKVEVAHEDDSFVNITDQPLGGADERYWQLNGGGEFNVFLNESDSQ